MTADNSTRSPQSTVSNREHRHHHGHHRNMKSGQQNDWLDSSGHEVGQPIVQKQENRTDDPESPYRLIEPYPHLLGCEIIEREYAEGQERGQHSDSTQKYIDNFPNHEVSSDISISPERVVQRGFKLNLHGDSQRFGSPGHPSEIECYPENYQDDPKPYYANISHPLASSTSTQNAPSPRYQLERSPSFQGAGNPSLPRIGNSDQRHQYPDQMELRSIRSSEPSRNVRNETASNQKPHLPPRSSSYHPYDKVVSTPHLKNRGHSQPRSSVEHYCAPQPPPSVPSMSFDMQSRPIVQTVSPSYQTPHRPKRNSSILREDSTAYSSVMGMQASSRQYQPYSNFVTNAPQRPAYHVSQFGSHPYLYGAPPLHAHYPYHPAIQYIESINRNDVLCGRGGATNSHVGNRSFRILVSKWKDKYLKAKKKEKPGVAGQLVDIVRNLDPPGRFLKKDGASGMWIDIGDERAREKTSQALREGAPEIRRQREKKSPGDRSSPIASGGSNEDKATKEANAIVEEEYESTDDEVEIIASPDMHTSGEVEGNVSSSDCRRRDESRGGEREERGPDMRVPVDKEQRPKHVKEIFRPALSLTKRKLAEVVMTDLSAEDRDLYRDFDPPRNERINKNRERRKRKVIRVRNIDSIQLSDSEEREEA